MKTTAKLSFTRLNAANFFQAEMAGVILPVLKASCPVWIIFHLSLGNPQRHGSTVRDLSHPANLPQHC
ncbi:MAG: hypothetical protein ABSG03_22950 [Bryobacteraceae bacterium]|jgi:hypothetical protein